MSNIKMMGNPIRFGIVGVGNCASALLQGITYYSRQLRKDPKPAGLVFEGSSGISVRDMVPVCAFDMDRRKLGLDLATAGLHPVNTVDRFCPDIEPIGVPVERGVLLDGCSPTNSVLNAGVAQEDRELPVAALAEEERRVRAIIRASAPDVMVNFLPVGSTHASRWYATACLQEGVSFINCIPVPLAKEMAEQFAAKQLIFMGDDIKSQFGATLVHRVLLAAATSRGMEVTRTYQLNVGGNSDFENMLDRSRLVEKRQSKTDAIVTAVNGSLPDMHITPSDHIPFLKDTKIAFIRMEGKQFGGLPFSLDLRLEVQDSPNCAGVVMEAIRVFGMARARGMAGYPADPCAFLFKSPLVQRDDTTAYELTRDFVAQV